MKHFFFFCVLFFLALSHSIAQQPHFVYLQTDNNQPFYVLLKGKNYSSSSIGYVILPKLENGDYRIKVGFAKSDMPEQDYLLKVKDNDQGYLIKNFGEKGGGIFNLQTLAIQYSGEIGRQLDATNNAQREEQKQKIIIQQQKDSTEKAEAVLAEQRRIDKEAKLIAAAAKQKEDAIILEKQRVADSLKADDDAKIAAINQKKDADALAKQQALNNVKTENEAKLLAAKQQKEVIALAKQQRIDSIKSVNANKIAAAKQKALAKHEADSIAAATNPVIKQQPVIVETLTQKKVRLAKEAAINRQSALALQANGQKTEEQKRQEATIAQNKAAEDIRRITDSLRTVEQNRVQVEQAAASKLQKKNEAALAKQQADEQAKLEEQKRQDVIVAQNKKEAENISRMNDSVNAIEKNKLLAQQNVVSSARNDSSLLIANSTTDHIASKNVNATIVYEPKVLNRIATDSGTVITYKIPSSKGWDTVTAFIKEPVVEKKEAPAEKKTVVETTDQPKQSDGVKFLDIHFKQDSANKSNDLITPVFKEDKPLQKVVSTENNTVKLPVQNKTVNTNAPTETVTPIGNSNCRAEANEKDFYALRKKMVAQKDADEMIMVAKKSMREKCYNTTQIRNLSVLLITDAERYQFLEAVYPFTSDAYNFGSLADLLKDNYYGERFKVMLKR